MGVGKWASRVGRTIIVASEDFQPTHLIPGMKDAGDGKQFRTLEPVLERIGQGRGMLILGDKERVATGKSAQIAGK